MRTCRTYKQTQCGITHAFVNWGSDHPALLEELERQRIASSEGKTDLEIITCPNEMVALSAAQGFAQVSGRPAAVLVHVDVGTQVSQCVSPLDQAKKSQSSREALTIDRAKLLLLLLIVR